MILAPLPCSPIHHVLERHIHTFFGILPEMVTPPLSWAVYFNALQPFLAPREDHHLLKIFVIILAVWSDPGSHAVQLT